MLKFPIESLADVLVLVPGDVAAARVADSDEIPQVWLRRCDG
jgi:hypothetical protein